MDALVTVEEYEARLPHAMSATERRLADELILDATALIARTMLDCGIDIDCLDDTDYRNAQAVCCSVVRRCMDRNSRGEDGYDAYSSPFAQTSYYDGAGAMRLLPSEMDRLGASMQFIGTLDMR